MQSNVKKWKYKTIAIMAPDSVSCLLRWCCFPSLCELFCRTSGELQLKSWVQGQTSDELPVGSNLGPSIIQGHTSLRSFRIPPSRPAAVVFQVWLLYLVLMDVSEWCYDVVTPTLFTGPHGHTHTVFIGCLSPCTWCLSISEFAPWSFQFRSASVGCSRGSKVL